MLLSVQATARMMLLSVWDSFRIMFLSAQDTCHHVTFLSCQDARGPNAWDMRARVPMLILAFLVAHRKFVIQEPRHHNSQEGHWDSRDFFGEFGDDGGHGYFGLYARV